ncbi:hypothetical protein HU200_042602 [Digitaria exilis]|uniref:Uncharacterized protein n=1 Tax=Digitaria exilis TaxID=1010633 RepID=A0A835B6Y2_9POAL|nr:hypothetical protein HU200_042602 [Digitaria exilis]
MRRSSSAARVAEGGASAGSGEAALPTYDPMSAAGRREAARTRALTRAVHCIPVVLLLCAFLLWLSASYHTHLGKLPFRLQTPPWPHRPGGPYLPPNFRGTLRRC